jgi:hypothetical protein
LAAARSEWEVLQQAGAGPRWFCERAMAWARASPDEARVPEALHLAVASTRWACSGHGLGGASRAAFRLLHSRYGSTTWAKKTKYWYDGW